MAYMLPVLVELLRADGSSQLRKVDQAGIEYSQTVQAWNVMDLGTT